MFFVVVGFRDMSFFKKVCVGQDLFCCRSIANIYQYTVLCAYLFNINIYIYMLLGNVCSVGCLFVCLLVCLSWFWCGCSCLLFSLCWLFVALYVVLMVCVCWFVCVWFPLSMVTRDCGVRAYAKSGGLWPSHFVYARTPS